MPRRKTRQPDPEDVFVDALEHIRPEYLACRERGHRWQLTSPFHLVDTRREDAFPRGGHSVYAERKFTCERCTKVRSEAFAIGTTARGHTSLRKIGNSSYTDPEGYGIKGAGNTAGMRDLLYGMAFDASQATTDRRRKKSA